MFIDRVDVTLKIPKENLDLSISYKEVFETLRALIGKGNDPDEFLLRLRILQYFEEGHYESSFHSKRQVAEALNVDEIKLREAFSDFQNHEVLVSNSSGNSYRLHNRAVMYLMYLKGFFIEQKALLSLKVQFARLQKLAEAMEIQDNSRKLLYRVYFDALDTIQELNEREQTKAVIKQKNELIDFFLELQPLVDKKLIEDFGYEQARIFFLNYVVLSGTRAILKNAIENARIAEISIIKRKLDPIVIEEYLKRVPSEVLLVLAKYSRNPLGIPAGSNKSAVKAYFGLFQEYTEEEEMEELPKPRSEESIISAGLKPPVIPLDMDDLALEYYYEIQNLLPTTLLSLISSSSLEDSLKKWYFIAILIKKNIIYLNFEKLKEYRENYAFFEDVEVIPLLI